MKTKGLKKSTSLLIALILFASSLSQFAYTAKGSMETALNNLNELCDTNFENNQYLTREEFCVVISKVFVENTSDVQLPFLDTEKIKQENIGYIASLYEQGYLSGSTINGGLYMLPDSQITRQEALVFLGRILGQSSNMTLTFSDSDLVAPYAYKSIAWFVENKIIVGYPNNTLGPRNVMTANELSILVLKTLDYKTQNTITTIMHIGTGIRGSDDGLNSAARFTLPYSVTFDNDGNLIIFDTYNNLIRKIKGNQTTTIIGKVRELDSRRYPKGFYLDSTLDKALFNRPTSGAYNSKGDLFIADSANNIIRFVKGDRVYTFSGTTAGFADGGPKTAMFNKPMAIAIDRNDIIYVADTLNNCIRKIDEKGSVTTIAGVPEKSGFLDGDASSALFLEPAGIAVSADGKTIYVADTGNHKIRKIEDGIVTTLAGATATEKDEDGYPFGGFANGNAQQAMFNQPHGITLADGLVIVADSANNMVRVITKSGNVVTICGNGEPGDKEGDPLGATLNRPIGVYVNNGLLYIADTLNNKIKVIPFDASIYE